MFELTEEQLAMRELRMAAYHEAGHKVLYQRFGGAGDAVVIKNFNRSPDETVWCGQFRPRSCPQVMHEAAIKHGIPAVHLPNNWRALVGIAGLVAEEILRGETDPDYIAGALDLRIASNQASTSDLKLMGITDIVDFELSMDLVVQAWRYLVEDWHVVQREAECLIEEAMMV